MHWLLCYLLHFSGDATTLSCPLDRGIQTEGKYSSQTFHPRPENSYLTTFAWIKRKRGRSTWKVIHCLTRDLSRGELPNKEGSLLPRWLTIGMTWRLLRNNQINIHLPSFLWCLTPSTLFLLTKRPGVESTIVTCTIGQQYWIQHSIHRPPSTRQISYFPLFFKSNHID